MYQPFFFDYHYCNFGGEVFTVTIDIIPQICKHFFDNFRYYISTKPEITKKLTKTSQTVTHFQ